jgi:hypothetical protein
MELIFVGNLEGVQVKDFVLCCLRASATPPRKGVTAMSAQPADSPKMGDRFVRDQYVLGNAFGS